jgi:uncharacterized OB-fold protein
MNLLDWIKTIKLSNVTGYRCNNCGNIIYKYVPISGMFCFSCPIKSLDLKKTVNFHTENGFKKVKPT